MKNIENKANDVVEINQKILEKLKENMPSKAMLDDLSDLFKVLGDATRMKIIYILLRNEMSVNEIVEYIGMTQSAISHQLNVLRRIRLVKVRKVGKMAYYSLNDEHISELFNCGLEHVKEKYYKEEK